MNQDQPSPHQLHAGYPIFVDLADRQVAVIGGGSVAERKIETLLEYDAQVEVVSPDATTRICELAESGAIRWTRREYAEGDLAGASIAFCACGIPEVDQCVVEEARRTNCLVNVVDAPALCDFVVPAIVRRGLLSVAVSTSGASCTEARNIRVALEDEYGADWEPYLDLMAELRMLVKQRVSGSEADRRPYYQAATVAGFKARLAKGELISPEEAFEEVSRMVESCAEQERGGF